MSRVTNKIQTIYLKMLLLLIAAMAAAAAVFFVLNLVGEACVEHYIENTDYTEREKQEVLRDFQEFVSGEHIRSRDTAELNQWVLRQNLISLSIYKGGILVFDSNYPDQEIYDEEIQSYDWMSYDTVEFEDGTAEVAIIGAFRYQIYTHYQIVEIIIAVITYLVIVLLGIHRKMAYVRLLSREVRLLEGGDLEYPITVKGYDEFSVLADGLDHMRRSFLESWRNEQEIVRRNRRMITEMSHDLRTPITSLMLYTEILRDGKYSDEAQADEFIGKIEKKALEIKQRTDRLLEYSLKPDEEDAFAEETDSFQTVFYDLISEACAILEQKGFRTETHIDWPDRMIRHNAEYTARIIDNIVSNIISYADPNHPVVIKTFETPDRAGIGFWNHASVRVHERGTGVGLQSVRNMMDRMGGECRTEFGNRRFGIELSFSEEKQVSC